MITRKDVAAYAGVSKTTVSRVLNNNGYVSPENREKVEHAIRELGYKPNLIARSLKTKQTRQILFYAPELYNPFYIEVYQGMEAYAVEKGYTIVVSSHYDHQIIQQRQFDGVILSGISPEKQDEFLKLDVPVVVTNYTAHNLTIPYVGMDIAGGAASAMAYLAECGHRKIAFITNAPVEGDQRYGGYRVGLERMGVSPHPGWIYKAPEGGTAYEQGYRATLELLDAGMDVTAIFAFNDVLAIGAAAALSARHIRIPETVSLVGFDDILQSRYTTPPLTTVHMPKYEQGQESARMLLRMIHGEKVKPMTLKTNLIIRESVSGPAR